MAALAMSQKKCTRRSKHTMNHLAAQALAVLDNAGRSLSRAEIEQVVDGCGPGRGVAPTPTTKVSLDAITQRGHEPGLGSEDDIIELLAAHRGDQDAMDDDEIVALFASPWAEVVQQLPEVESPSSCRSETLCVLRRLRRDGLAESVQIRGRSPRNREWRSVPPRTEQQATARSALLALLND